jgi:2-iminoacetate synthase ThiH
MTVMRVSISLHVAGFLFWVIIGAYTMYRLKKDYQQKGEELERIYDEAREVLEANVKNVQKLSHEVNKAYMHNLFGGDDDVPVS